MQDNFAFAVQELAQFGPERDGALAGPIGMFIITTLMIVIVFLVWNMNKRLKRMPETFHSEETSPEVTSATDKDPTQ